MSPGVAPGLTLLRRKSYAESAHRYYSSHTGIAGYLRRNAQLSVGKQSAVGA